MLGVEGAETTETGVHHPKLVVAIPGKLVDVDAAGDMDPARQIAGVVFARGLELFRQGRHVAVLPDGVSAADCQPGGVGDDTHGLGECSEVSVEPAVIIADDDGLARLISGYDQADPQPVE
jgi:hypothetical protein